MRVHWVPNSIRCHVVRKYWSERFALSNFQKRSHVGMSYRRKIPSKKKTKTDFLWPTRKPFFCIMCDLWLSLLVEFMEVPEILKQVWQSIWEPELVIWE